MDDVVDILDEDFDDMWIWTTSGSGTGSGPKTGIFQA